MTENNLKIGSSNSDLYIGDLVILGGGVTNTFSQNSLIDRLNVVIMNNTNYTLTISIFSSGSYVIEPGSVISIGFSSVPIVLISLTTNKDLVNVRQWLALQYNTNEVSKTNTIVNANTSETITNYTANGTSLCAICLCNML